MKKPRSLGFVLSPVFVLVLSMAVGCGGEPQAPPDTADSAPSAPAAETASGEVAGEEGLFAEGFETGDTSHWTTVTEADEPEEGDGQESDGGGTDP